VALKRGRAGDDDVSTMVLSLLILLTSIVALVWMRRDAKGRDWSRSSWIKTPDGWSILAFCIGIGALPYYLQQRAKCASAVEAVSAAAAPPAPAVGFTPAWDTAGSQAPPGFS
jgi:hypothetical protein